MSLEDPEVLVNIWQLGWVVLESNPSTTACELSIYPYQQTLFRIRSQR